MFSYKTVVITVIWSTRKYFRQFGTKPSSKPMMAYGPLRTKFNQFWMKIHQSSLKKNWEVRLHNGGHFVSPAMYQSMGIVQVMRNQPWQVCNQMFVCKRKRVLKTSWSLNPTKGILIKYLNPTWCEWSLWWMIDLNIQCIYSMYIIQRFVGYCQPRRSVTPNVSAMHLQIVALCYQGHL